MASSPTHGDGNGSNRPGDSIENPIVISDSEDSTCSHQAEESDWEEMCVGFDSPTPSPIRFGGEGWHSDSLEEVQGLSEAESSEDSQGRLKDWSGLHKSELPRGSETEEDSEEDMEDAAMTSEGETDYSTDKEDSDDPMNEFMDRDYRAPKKPKKKKKARRAPSSDEESEEEDQDQDMGGSD